MENVDQLAQMERVRYVTRNFQSFQGYRVLPWVPALLLWGGSESGLLRGNWWLWAFAASIGVAIAGWVTVDRWYRRTYGTVQRRWDNRRLAVTAATVLGLVGLAVLGFWLGMTGRSWPDEVTSWEGAVVGVFFAVSGWAARAVVPAHLWSGVAVVVVSALPLGMLDAFGGLHPFRSDGGFFLLLAAIIAVQGVASHVALDRMLGHARAEPEVP